MSTAIVKLEEVTADLKELGFHPSRELAITLVNAAHNALLAARADGDPAAAHEVRKKLKTIEDWFKLQRARLIDSNLVVAERLRAERTIGGMLADPKGGIRRGGDRKSKYRDSTLISRLPPGLDRHDSSNWKRVTQIAEADFEQWVLDMTTEEEEISTAALLRLWRELFPPLETETPPLPDGIFQVLYADPPWEYQNSGFEQSAAQQYSTMPTDKICQLKDRAERSVTDLAADDSALFLWVTSPLLQDGIEVLLAWGFEYKASMVWIKNRAPGIRFWVDTRHELLLIGSRGSFLPKITPTSVIEADVTIHSRKPEIFYKIIEDMYPTARRSELFARERRDGWTAWGNEIDQQ